jgi:hypothetical protein
MFTTAVQQFSHENTGRASKNIRIAEIAAPPLKNLQHKQVKFLVKKNSKGYSNLHSKPNLNATVH